MNHYLLSLLFVLISSIGFSQNGNISGKIVDTNQEPLAFANVLLLNPKDSSLVKGNTINDDGSYLFHDIIEGKYIINSSLVGFGEVYSEPIEHDGKNNLEVALLQLIQGIKMEEVVISEQKPFIELKANKMIVNVANSSINAGNSALEVLEKAPGVVLDNEQNISLRGKQGVLVTINGKNQYLSGDQLTRMLASMPSSNIQSIEIITNPSAKYDAEGNSGIINIVLKKNENLGYNGSISTSIKQGAETTNFSQSLNLNQRSEKLHLFGSAEFSHWDWVQEMALTREIQHSEGQSNFDQLSNFNDKGDDFDIRLGANYALSSKTELGLMFKGSTGMEMQGIENSTNIDGYNTEAFDILEVSSLGYEDINRNSYNLNFSHRLNDKGTKIKWDADVMTYRNPAEYDYDNYYFNNVNDEVAPMYTLKNMQNTDINILASTLDFEHTIGEKIKLETGIKFSSVETTNNTTFEEKDVNGEWQQITNRSNDFMYDEKVSAAYINGSGKAFGLMLQAGLRVEHTNSNGDSPTLNLVVPRKYTDFFPSLSVSKAFKNGHNLSANYSRRIQRPNYSSLNPFEHYLDQYTFRRGNSFLNPQYANSFGLNYAIGRKLFIAGNFSHTTDAITSVIEQDTENNINYQTQQNLDNQISGSLTISKPFIWGEKFTSRLNYTSYYSKFSSVIQSGQLETENLAHIFSLNNEIKLPGNISMEWSADYKSKMVFGLFQIDPQYSTDIGFSKKILKGKGSLRFALSDVFRTRRSFVLIDQDDIFLTSTEVQDTRRVTVNFNYSFGNQKVKGAKKRKTAANQLGNRI